MVQCSVEKQQQHSPSLLSDCLMVVSTLVRPEAHPSLLLDEVKVLSLRVSPLDISSHDNHYGNCTINVVPAPTSVSVTSDQANPLAVRPIGATVTLTCTVVLSASVDVPVTVNTVWTGPDNFNSNITAQRMGSTTTYTSTVTVSSFGRDQSGNYTCTATVSSASPSPFITGNPAMSGTSRITVGKRLT